MIGWSSLEGSGAVLIVPRSLRWSRRTSIRRRPRAYGLRRGRGRNRRRAGPADRRRVQAGTFFTVPLFLSVALVPRRMAMLGLIGGPLVLISAILILFDVVDPGAGDRHSGPAGDL